MTIFENFTKKVTDTAKAAARKSSEIVEVTKLNMSIGAEEDKINKVYTEIGKAVYVSYAKGEVVNEVFVGSCEKVKAYEANISEMKQKILEIKNVKICEGCGAELEADVIFCSKCGSKQETKATPEPTPVAATVKKCPACGVECETVSSFCTKCGASL